MTLRVTEAGERGAPVVVLAHGFPELAYSWRHQIPALADAGYHVLAPDQRGYGGSSKPGSRRGLQHRRADRRHRRPARRRRRRAAVLVGHDWGAMVAWTPPLLHPDRFAGVVGLSVPPVPRPPGAADAASGGRSSATTSSTSSTSRSRAWPTPNSPATRPRTLRRLMGGSPRPATQAAALRMLAPGPEGFIDRLPEPGGLPGLDQPRTSSTTTSRSSPAPGSPAR